MGTVTPFGDGRGGAGGGGGPRDPDKERWLRRQAMQLAQHLPENTADARQILMYVEWLLLRFIDNPKI